MGGVDRGCRYRQALVRPGEPALGPPPASLPGRAFRAAMRWLSALHAPVVWRLLYGALARRSVVALVARALRALGPERALTAVTRLEQLTVWSGWPHQAPGWMNLDASRFAFRLRRALAPPAPPLGVRAPRPDPVPLRIGVAGEMSVLLTFSADHLRLLPDDVELAVFDTEYAGRHATYVAATEAAYTAFGHVSQANTVAALAAAIDASALDLLLVFLPPDAASSVIERVSTPCVSYLPTGSDLLHHPRVGFHLFVQPEADYFVRGGHLFCGTSRAAFGDELVIPGSFVYDARGIDEGPLRSWSERDPLVFFHGALYKLASEPYLDAILRLLELDPELEFIFMGRGKDYEPRLEAILATVGARGLGSRVHYEGAYARFRSVDGRTIDDPGWERLASHLRRARLAPNPFPMGGGSSRVEAYLLGTPTVHMGVRYDREAWGRPQHSVVDLPALTVARGTAFDPNAYEDLCLRCLYDEAFADALAAEQLEVARRVTDATGFWRQLVSAYALWAARNRKQPHP